MNKNESPASKEPENTLDLTSFIEGIFFVVGISFIVIVFLKDNFGERRQGNGAEVIQWVQEAPVQVTASMSDAQRLYLANKLFP